MKIKFVSWNVRGLNGESKRALVRNLLLQWGDDIHVLVETKLTRNDSNLYQQIWINRWLGEAHVEAIGRSGGIVVLWDKRVWKGEMVDSGNQMPTCRFEGIEQELKWHLSAIYADCDRGERRELWWELAAIRSLFEGSWVVCGDFNITGYPEERTNCQRINGGMTEFSEWINDMELVALLYLEGLTLGEGVKIMMRGTISTHQTISDAKTGIRPQPHHAYMWRYGFQEVII
ncbi:hypothetical protein H5410_016211 [Solanum commersonii]|uniref:Endonuclease/exonuclease/phosphatase domain-containing protein n=1 Tax=Solanum commersonii TaxID=4109 RepID=A0A9J5ZWD5_SOLCO|nr:hypothetical protein H5410_016211 [Solanum commersonii]